MSAIPRDVLDVQRAASDPAVSTWVAANAGSGKTHVLAQRVIRLLLAGTQPEKILCLTYTKAAAANMANRVFDTLGKWTALDDRDLDAEIAKVEGRKPSTAQRLRARRLFAQALDTPGGLKVQTIHAFATRLLQQFPFEADVAARFEVLEERIQSEMLDRQRLAVLLDAAARPDSDLGRALSYAITAAADVTFAQVVGEAIARRDAVTAWIKDAGGVEAAIADLSAALGVDPDDTLDRIDAEITEGPLFPSSEWGSVAALCQTGSANDQRQCERLSNATVAIGRERLDAYVSVFITDKSEPRKSVITATLAKKHPELAQRLIDEQERLPDLLTRRRAVEARERTAALITISAAVIERVRAEKERRGLLDYDDLIDKALALLAEERAAWVHYKLDLGVDHVLIDEAQDTSAKQWDIIDRLVAEFAAGSGARDMKRTIFAVGDEKQSIFSFQGADPAQFATRRDRFHRRYEDSGLEFRRREFKHSFRSGANVLGAVDAVFSLREVFAGVTTDDGGFPPHIAVRDQSPGLVEIWPLIEPKDKPAIEGWDAPFDTTSETSPRVVLAQKIARTAKRWIARGDRVGEGEKRHAVRPGDILVLVRQRGALFEAIIRALKAADIPVAGADRLVLTEHIAVMDLMILADALLLTDDDLALATVLKSPLFGLDDEQLFRLAFGRNGSLRTALLANGDPAFVEAATKLDRYAQWARHEAPFSFYARILGAEGARKRFYARLGAEAADALDEFLEHALAYERREAPTLQGFVAWLRAGSTEVKRDMDIARDEVRVMTVHGAKGLEAPIVILADTTTRPEGPYPPRLLALPGSGVPDAPERLVWAGRKADDGAPVAAARAEAVRAAENEYRRLLYVAMTRAADRLVVAGARGVNAEPPGCWYRLVYDPLVRDAAEEAADDGDGTVWRWRKAAQEELELPLPETTRAPAPAVLPDWLTRDAPPAPKAIRAITPSAAFDASRPAKGDARALARGRVIHRLLQALPAIPPERRAEAARRYARRDDAAFSDTECTAVATEVLAVLDDPRFAPLFAPGSRAEVPIVGRVTVAGRTVAVSGVVDRLAVTAGAVLIADYKTNRPAPRRPEDIPADYMAQLALYRAVLARLYPGREVRAALVWTEGPNLMEMPTASLDAALSRVAGAT